MTSTDSVCQNLQSLSQAKCIVNNSSNSNSESGSCKKSKVSSIFSATSSSAALRDDREAPASSSSPLTVTSARVGEQDTVHKKLRELKLEHDPLASLHLNYKSGAIYDGQLVDNVKSGSGTFLWPNGDRYNGEFSNNSRHGYGVQQWSDGSRYEGYFVDDKRAGKGVHVWKNGEVSSFLIQFKSFLYSSFVENFS